LQLLCRSRIRQPASLSESLILKNVDGSGPGSSLERVRKAALKENTPTILKVSCVQLLLRNYYAKKIKKHFRFLNLVDTILVSPGKGKFVPVLN
jgi:hypothetical protein